MRAPIRTRVTFLNQGLNAVRRRHRAGIGVLSHPAAFLVLMLGLFCTLTGPAGAYTPMIAGDSVPRIDFIDSRQFDTDFSKLLKTGPDRVTARFIGTVSVNKIPERLDKWLSAVRYLGGRVDIQPEPATETVKVVGDVLISLAVGSYLLVTHVLRYDPAMDYNAVVYYDRADGTLTRVVFTRKSDPPVTRKDRIVRWFQGIVN